MTQNKSTKTNELVLPEGFACRSGILDDIEAVVKLFNICSLEMVGKEEFEESHMLNDWKMPGYSQETDQRLVFGSDNQIVAFCEVWALEDMPVHPFVRVRVYPDFRGMGLGTTLTEWGETRARKVLDIVPADALVTMHSVIIDGFPPAKDLLENYGMKLVRHGLDMQIEMETAPSEPVWPEGITLDTYHHPDEDQLRAIYLADVEAFQDHHGFVPEDPIKGFERFKHHFVEAKETFDPALWFIAMDGEEIAGICICRKWSHDDKESGWISDLAVRRAWRKRGIGLAFLKHSFKVYWERGFKKVGLDVDASSLTGALRLYENAGMHVTRRYDKYEKELRPGKELGTVSLEE